MTNLSNQLKSFFRSFGYVISNSKWSYCDPIADQVRLAGKDARTIFDVGANNGNTVQNYLVHFPQSKIFAFEPTKTLASHLRKRFLGNGRVTIEEKAISNADGTANFVCANKDMLNSLLALNTNYDSAVEIATHDVSTTTIDSYCNSNSIDRVDVLKIDIQGAEKLAFEGAVEMLKSQRIHVVYSEMQFTKIYADQTRPEEVLSILAAKGYVLYGLYEISRASNGCIDFCNGLFVSNSISKSLNSNYLYQGAITDQN